MGLRLAVRDTVESVLVATIGRHLWAPTSAAVLVECDGDVLVVDVGGAYELPGGLVRAGEDVRTAARREVREETGLAVELGNLLDMRTVSRGNEGIHYIFAGEVVGGELDGSWEGEPRFVQRDALRKVVWRAHHSHVHDYLFPDEDATHG